MSREMSAELFLYWKAYLSQRYMEQSKQDYAIARLSALVANIMSDGRMATEEDMLIVFTNEVEAEKLQDQKDLAFMTKMESIGK